MSAPDPEHSDIDPHTTAGKLAELEPTLRRGGARRLGPGGREAARQGQEDRARAHRRPCSTRARSSNSTSSPGTARRRSAWSENRPFGDGVVTGYGTVDGRPVCVFSQDVTVFGGSLGEVYGEKIVKVLDFAMKTGCPVVGINEGGGARIQEGVVRLGLYGEIFYRNVQASGVIPQISLIMGAAAGGHVYSPALTDFVVMVDKTSQMFITGPDVVKTVTGEDVTLEELGGARTHNTTSGNAHYLGLRRGRRDQLRQGAAVLPAEQQPRPAAGLRHRRWPTDVHDDDAFLDTFIPDSANQPYDMHEIIEHLLDDGEFLEVHALFAPNIVVGFGRIEGYPVGVVANQPTQFAGCLDIDASEKAARFVRTCDAFNVPVLTLVDVPGFLPGVGQEHAGIIRRGAKLIYAYAEATVPKITDRHPQGVRRGVRRHGLQAPRRRHQRRVADRADRGDGRAGRGEHPVPQGVGQGRRSRGSCGPSSSREYEDTLVNPYIAAERGYIDSVIPPSHTRSYVIRSLRMLRNKRADAAAEEAREHPAMTMDDTTSHPREPAGGLADRPRRADTGGAGRVGGGRRSGRRRADRRTTSRTPPPRALERPAARTPPLLAGRPRRLAQCPLKAWHSVARTIPSAFGLRCDRCQLPELDRVYGAVLTSHSDLAGGCSTQRSAVVSRFGDDLDGGRRVRYGRRHTQVPPLPEGAQSRPVSSPVRQSVPVWCL